MPSLSSVKVKQKGISGFALVIILAILLTVGAIYYLSSRKDDPEKLLGLLPASNSRPSSSFGPSESGKSANLSNPASEYCIRVGGQLQSEVRGDGGAYSLCNFEDNQSCEEWALYRKQCPIGGIKTMGFDTKEEAYCALIGGKTTTISTDCKLPSGKICSNLDLYNGKCQ